ncbi:MAG: glycosyltransferase [Candidatus Brocadiia bacterium]
MARILLSAPDDKPWSYGSHLAVALRELGCQVVQLDFRSAGDPDAALLRMARQCRPALHLVWKGEAYSPETFRRLSVEGIYNVVWYPDATVPEWLPALARASDLVCTQGLAARDRLREMGVPDVCRLVEGITPSCFECGEITPAHRRRYGCEVVTIGTVDRAPGYLRRLDALNRLIREGFRVRWWGRRMSWRRNLPWRIFSPARRAYGGSMVWGPTYARACRCAKIFLALPRFPQQSGGLSNRAFWVTGLGAFYLTLHKAGIEEFFEAGREIAVFRDEDEMVEKVRYYLAHEDERKAIARAGQQRTLSNYTNHHAMRKLFSMVAERGGPVVQVGG